MEDPQRPKCPSTDDQRRDPYTQPDVAQPQKEGNPALCDNTMDLEGVMLSEMSQRQVPYDRTYMWNLKIKINEQTRQNKFIQRVFALFKKLSVHQVILKSGRSLC